jgi:hypothetical protein
MLFSMFCVGAVEADYSSFFIVFWAFFSLKKPQIGGGIV